MALSQMDGYDEVMEKLLAKLPPERRLRLAGLSPEQVLHMYSAEELLLALPDEMLRLLPDEAFAKLSEPTRDAIRARLGR